mmetsp:Transcript_36394/g.77620  ORF Transcript_36394/g.77620 Transcript_36394/m.77620 type:complete len:285 (+) Transcript_36394:583-1437(+)
MDRLVAALGCRDIFAPDTALAFLDVRLGFPPVSHWLTWLAKRNEQRVSCELSSSGATLTTMSVLPFPERHGSIRYVSFELRKGTCDWRAALAAKTSARLERLLLMFCVSRSAVPVAPDLSSRSEPARSTRCSAPCSSVPRSRFTPLRKSWKTECERDDCAFMSVDPTARCFAARTISALISSIELTSSRLRPVTTVPHASSCLIARLELCALLLFRRSRSVSLYTSRNDASRFHAQPSARILWDASRILLSERGISPQLAGSGFPCIVYVLPEPVCPYAKMHTL